MTNPDGGAPRLLVQGLRCFKDRVPVPLDEGLTGLIGLNNGGKTSLLRLPWELRPLFNSLDRGITDAHSNPRSLQTQAIQSLDGERVPSHLAGSQPLVIFEMGPPPPEIPESVWPTEATFDVADGFAQLRTVELDGTTIECTGASISRVAVELDDQKVAVSRINRIPVYDKAIIAFADALERCTYFAPFRNVINVGGNRSYYDLSVGEQFVRQFHSLKAGPNAAENEAVAQLQREIESIFGFERFEINAVPEMQSMQVTIDGVSYRLSELGAGLTHFVVILTNALVRKPTWLLVDEPELNLHATLQLELLLTASSYASTGVTFATHSLGLARSTADRVLVVSRDEHGVGHVSDYEDHPRLAQLAGELSFAGTPSLGFEQILLVEGKTDVKTFQQLLALYDASQQILVLSLSGDDHINGDSAIELGEILRIGAPVGAVIDSERVAASAPLSEPRKAFVELCNDLGIDCHVLDRRAIENYLTPVAVSAVLTSEPASAIGHFDKMPAGWKKRNNWRAARHLSLTDIEDTDLGKWLGSFIASET